MPDHPRTRPRVMLTTTQEARDMGERLATDRGLASLSALVEALIREEERRVRWRDRAATMTTDTEETS